MIKMLTAYTAEVDDIEAAVAEIQDQLAQGGALARNTIGLIACYPEFIDSGVLQALSEALPFDVIGTTTLGCAVQDSDEPILLTLMVLTSDDVRFSAGLTEPILSLDEGPLQEAYTAAAAKLPERAALIISFAPLLMNASGDFFINTMNRVSGGVPNFGTLTVDNTTDYSLARTLYNGEAYPDRYAFVLLQGDVQPKFFMASLSPEKVLWEKGIVTASQGNQLQTVNNLPVGDYLVSLGMTRNPDGSITGINAFPFVVDYNDGTEPVVRVMFALTPEGYAVCGGDIPVGATLSAAAIDAKEVLSTTEKMLREVVEKEKPAGILAFSCVGRYFSLGYNARAEVNVAQEVLNGTGIPYQFVYSGGELCPVYGKDGGRETTNRNHNDTCVLCIL